jgi:hypothetical protein
MFKVSLSAAIALLYLSFLGACGTNTQDGENAPVFALSGNIGDSNCPMYNIMEGDSIVGVITAGCSDYRPEYEHPELADIDFGSFGSAPDKCWEETQNGETFTACSGSMNISAGWGSLLRYKDSVETDYIRTLCSNHPDRVLTYITTPDSKGGAIFENVKYKYSQTNGEFAVLTVHVEEPIPGDTKPRIYDDRRANGTTWVKLPLFSRNCEPLVKLSASKVGDTLKIESNGGKGIDYNSDCSCNFNISYAYNYADENIEFVDIDGKVFPTRYELNE